MTKIQKVSFLFLLPFILISSLLGSDHKNQEIIQIKPIEIPTSPKKATNAYHQNESSETILSKLQIAIKNNQTKATLTTKDHDTKIIANLQKAIKKQKVKKSIVKSKIKKKIKHSKVVIKKPKKTKKPKKIISSPKKISINKKVLLNNKSTESKTHLSDADYFDTIETIEPSNNHAPLKFVETLGVVAVSNQYEIDFIIPPKVELAKEEVVNISNASIETEALKNLEFVKTLGVVKVSKEFETTQATYYLEE
ncbi:MAG: Unknown protein [uncultured Sulfurovum sp.]|uniref:Uncharacterized protein n=1 Tax=uncultured Sulfurovum sp. TaxID=269237 RepID=A0A6S6SIG3_9BACT|nr:MAG: Unknown protein [uncultured Sulfurovum sp.]